MKKFLALLGMLFIAAGAYAQEAAKGPDFKYSLKGWVYGVSGAQKDYEYDYSHIRFRPLFSAGTDNVKAVVQLEIDQDFGRGTDENVNADPGTDNKVVEVKHAYLEVKDAIVPGVTLMGGLNGYKFPVVVDNDFALFQAGFDFGMGKAILSYIQIDEYEYAEATAADPSVKQNKDITAYALDLPIKAGMLTVRPGVIYIKGGNESALAQKASMTNYALNITGDMGVVAFTASGAYMGGTLSDNGTTKVETSAFGADLGVDVKPADGIKLGVFFTYGTGNDGKDAEKDDSYFYNLNKLFGKTSNRTGAPDGRLFLLENASITGVGGHNIDDNFDVMDNQLGWMAYGINAQAKIDKLTLFVQYGIASTVEKNANDKTGIGSELDAKVSYLVGPKTDLFVEGAYFMSSDDMGVGKYTAAENAYQVAWGLITSI